MEPDTRHDENQPGCPSESWACIETCEIQDFSLTRACDVRGLLHCHTNYADGAHCLESLIETSRALGLEYLGVTDKVRTADEPDGLDEKARRYQRAEIVNRNAELTDLVLLRGVEIEADARGDLPLSDDELGEFDYVVATVRNNDDLTREERTARALRVVMNPFVNILGHPVGEWMTQGGDLPVDMEALLKAAGQAGVALEIDANPTHDHLDWGMCRRAQELGVLLVVASDAYRAARLADYRHGVELTRQAGLCCQQILNTRPMEYLRGFFRIC